MTEHTRSLRVLVSRGDHALDAARTQLEHLATEEGHHLTSEPRIIDEQQHAGLTFDLYEADAEPMTHPNRARVTIYPAGAELIGSTPQGDPVAADQDGAGTGLDLTRAIIPGSIHFTTS